MLIFPKTINADGLLPFLGQLAEHAEAPELLIDFSGLHRISPAGLAALTAFMAGRERRRLATNIVGLEACGIRDYLRRMNLLRLCGWSVKRNRSTAVIRGVDSFH
jgi:ABC-type transporter Mla MlaB component